MSSDSGEGLRKGRGFGKGRGPEHSARDTSGQTGGYGPVLRPERSHGRAGRTLDATGGTAGEGLCMEEGLAEIHSGP